MRKLMCLVVALGFTALAYAEELNLKIDGMVCPNGCVKKVETALSNVKGVTAKKVEVGTAKVTYDSKQTSKDEIVKAIEKAGYNVAKQ